MLRCSRVLRITYLCALFFLCCGFVNDSTIFLTQTPAGVAAQRQALITYIWGGTLPTRQPTFSVGVSNPITHSTFTNLASVDQVNMTMDEDQRTFGYYFHPTIRNNRLVIFHHGHDCTMDDGTGSGAPNPYGEGDAVASLVNNHFDVIALFMIHMNSGDHSHPGLSCGGTPNPHDCIFATQTNCNDITPNTTYGGSSAHFNTPVATPTQGTALQYFLEPVSMVINYILQKRPLYQDISMVGLSGGGWTTHWIAALYPQIHYLIPIAGSVPLYMRESPHDSDGDTEQNQTAIYTNAGYLDLYVMGSAGKIGTSNRKMLWTLNSNDNCCFGPAQYGAGWQTAVDNVSSIIATALATIGIGGTFTQRTDTVATVHQISSDAITNAILSTLGAP